MAGTRIAIVGGGFTGTILAVHLLRAATSPLDIRIVEGRAALGRGVAYGTERSEHRINVPADKMWVFEEDRAHFARWMIETGRHDADPEALAPNGDHYSRRRDFAAYMSALLHDTVASVGGGHTVAHYRAVATGIERNTGGGFMLSVSEGATIYADRVAITASYGAPALPWPADPATADARLVRDPWAPNALDAVEPKDRVLVVGTGLTMADMTISLRRQGHQGEIVALSRHGLLPKAHDEFDGNYDFLDGVNLPVTASRLLLLIRQRVRALAATGRHWHPVVDSVRRQLPQFWPLLPMSERARIVKRLRAFWDVHRFRIAPQVEAELRDGIACGWLSIETGRLVSLEKRDTGYVVSWGPSKSGAVRREVFDAVVNCTGPIADIARSDNPLFRSLLDVGMATPDPLRLGICIDASSTVLGETGPPVDGLFVAGPLARGRFGETIGVPDASNHARIVACMLAAPLAPTSNGPPHPNEERKPCPSCT